MKGSRQPLWRRVGVKAGAVCGAAAVLMLSANAGAGAATSPSQQWVTNVSAPSTLGVGETMTATFGTSGVSADIQVTGGNTTVAWPGPGGPLGGTNVTTYIEPDPPADSMSIGQGVNQGQSITEVITFNKPVIAPVLHVMNLDGSWASVQGTTTTGAPITLTPISKNNAMEVSGNQLNTTQSVATNGGCQADDGTNPTAACGSFTLGGGLIKSFTLTNQEDIASGDSWNWSMSFPTAPLTKTFSPTTIAPGQTSQLTFSIANPANPAQPTLTPLDFTDLLPSGLTLADASLSANGNCGSPTVTDQSGGALAAGNTGVKASNISVAAGATCTLTVNVTSTTPGSYTNNNSNLATGVANLIPSADPNTTLTVAETPPVPMVYWPIGLGAVALGASGWLITRGKKAFATVD